MKKMLSETDRDNFESWVEQNRNTNNVQIVFRTQDRLTILCKSLNLNGQVDDWFAQGRMVNKKFTILGKVWKRGTPKSEAVVFS